MTAERTIPVMVLAVDVRCNHAPNRHLRSAGHHRRDHPWGTYNCNRSASSTPASQLTRSPATSVPSTSTTRGTAPHSMSTSSEPSPSGATQTVRCGYGPDPSHRCLAMLASGVRLCASHARSLGSFGMIAAGFLPKKDIVAYRSGRPRKRETGARASRATSRTTPALRGILLGCFQSWETYRNAP